MPSRITGTAEVDKSVDRIAIPLKKKRLEKMYLPIAVEKALIEVCYANNATTSDVVVTENLSLLSEVSVYHTFLNKIAQACDNMKGGGTINSVTIKQTPEAPVFIIAFNRRTLDEAEDTVRFLKTLLSLVGQYPEELKPKPLQKMVLWRILLHHVHRIDHYLTGLSHAIDECVDHCLRHGETDAMQDLWRLENRVKFPRDILTSEATKDKFLSDCETLIKAIVAMKDSALGKVIQSNAKQGHATESSCWCSLRHFMGRLHSYRQAAEVITGAAQRWPRLFDDLDVLLVPSSEPASRPLRCLRKTSAEVIDQVLEGHDLDSFKDDIARFEAMGLYKAIKRQLSNQNFKPYVHSEVLLHSHLLESGVNRDSDFFNGWKVIGTSKPICRLCHYYFANHPDKIRVREQHPNLYTSWRLADIYNDQGTGAVHARDKMIDCIIRCVTQDAINMLQDRLARRKTYDSNTYTSIPGRLEFDSDSDSDSEPDFGPHSEDDGDIARPTAGPSIEGSPRITQTVPLYSAPDTDSEGGSHIDNEDKEEEID